MLHVAIWNWYMLLCIYTPFLKKKLTASVHPFFCLYIYTFFKSCFDKSTEWSTIPACPSLMCFFNRGYTEGTNSSKLLCLTFVCVLLYMQICVICVRTDFVVLGELWFHDLCEE